VTGKVIIVSLSAILGARRVAPLTWLAVRAMFGFSSPVLASG
jgi:hypothetical protein